MNKHRFTWGLVLSLIIIGLLTPFIVWELKGKQVLQVAILDKTVPDTSYRQHQGLVWLLNHLKYVKEDRTKYAVNKDYYGFFPGDNKTYQAKELDLSSNPDLLYIADTYGIDEGEVHGTKRGGLLQEDVQKIKSAVYKGMPLIAEFNTFGSPTDAEVKKSLYKILGLEWNGWIGRSFPDLSKDKEVPSRAVSAYEKQSGNKWEFHGSGFVFVSEKNEVVVLEGEKDSGKNGCTFSLTQEGENFIGKKINVRFNNWFDITQPYNDMGVLANYQLDLTDSGQKKLNEKGISPTFPAVIRNDAGSYTSYYFAGDFANQDKAPSFYRLSGLERLFFWLERDTDKSLQPFYWKAYVPMMKKILGNIAETKKHPPQIKSPDLFHDKDTKLSARTNNMELQIYKDGKWQPHFVKGVNMGMATPGKWFTELPKDEADYLRWFQMIGEMNSNTIRVYTLMDPSFYRALYAYNQKHSDAPLWLLQEIWPEEEVNGHNFLGQEYNRSFHKEIENAVDAVHGKASIPERVGRAYGQYTADVSPYVLGYLVGRELEPDDVLETDKINSAFRYEGEYVAVKNGTPTEGWLAWSCDYVVSYEEKAYQWQHPVAIVSWPTLDPMKHDSEWNQEGDPTKVYNDKATVDIRHFSLGSKIKAGFFGAYHIYPNYPDFMNNEVKYDAYRDEQGRFRYGGYLKEFIENHTGYPALVAEFGLATGMGNAHLSPDGYHHGGMSEKQQGQGVVRMMKSFRNEGYAGGIIFEWMDEWAKKTWTTEPFMVPYERHVLWHNMIDPEQNYGILATDSNKHASSDYALEGNGNVKRVEMRADLSYLYIDLLTNRAINWSKEQFMIGLDTYDKNRGEMKYRPDLGISSPTGMEFLVDLKGEQDAKLLVSPSYNTGSGKYSSQPGGNGQFEEIRPLINKGGVRKNGTSFTEHFEDGSTLKYGDFGASHQWYTEGNTLHIRLPWGRLNVTDPSSQLVLDDPGNPVSPARNSLKTRKTEGIRISAVWLNKNKEIIEQFPAGNKDAPPYLWRGWESPAYKERLKGSYPVIQEYFKTLQ